MNVAVELPLVTVTLAGTLAAALSSESATTIPAAGAGPLSATVPVDGLPPTTLVGLSETDESATAGVIVKGAVLLTLL